MEEVSAAQYSKALRKQLGDAGLQGALQADAFKLLLQYMTDEQADQQVMALILEQLKQGESLFNPYCAPLPLQLASLVQGCSREQSPSSISRWQHQVDAINHCPIILACCYSVCLWTALEDDGLVSIQHVQAAIRMQAGSTRDPDQIVVVDAFMGAQGRECE